MNTNLMRKIDFWVGVPCCLLLTIWDLLLRTFRKPPTLSRPVKRIVFIELAETGGLVVACPALEHARRRFPEAEIYFMTFTLGKGILGLIGFEEERQIIIRTSGLVAFVLDTWRAIMKMRELEIDSVVNLETYARFSTMLAYFSGAERRAGFFRFHEEGHYVGNLVTHKLVYNPHFHASQTFISLVESLGEEVDAEPRVKRPIDKVSLELPRVRIDDEKRGVIWNKLSELYPQLGERHRLVLLNPNASDLVVARRWPSEYFIELAWGLLEHPDVLIVFTGAPDERPAIEQLAAQLNSERALIMAGRTTLPQLIDLYNVSHLLVTNDSGPAHFASLTDIPVLVLFGPETPGIYGPLGPGVESVYLKLACSPCVSSYNQKLSPCTDNQCLKRIKPDVILRKALAVLGLSGTSA